MLVFREHECLKNVYWKAYLNRTARWGLDWAVNKPNHFLQFTILKSIFMWAKIFNLDSYVFSFQTFSLPSPTQFHFWHLHHLFWSPLMMIKDGNNKLFSLPRFVLNLIGADRFTLFLKTCHWSCQAGDKKSIINLINA